VNIVGTPWKSVTRSRSMIASARPASKREISVRHPPAVIVALSAQVWPKEWNRGSAPSVTSVSPSAWSEITARALRVRFSCVSSAPFGRPVVPDVYSSTAVSEGARSLSSRSGRAVRSSFSSSPGVTKRDSAPACLAPASAGSATPCHASSRLAPASPR
jgi:hypothetical protein